MFTKKASRPAPAAHPGLYRVAWLDTSGAHVVDGLSYEDGQREFDRHRHTPGEYRVRLCAEEDA